MLIWGLTMRCRFETLLVPLCRWYAVQIKLIPDQQEAMASVIRVQTSGGLKGRQGIVCLSHHHPQLPMAMWLPSRAGVPALPILQAQAKAAAFRSHVFPIRYAHEEVRLLQS